MIDRFTFEPIGVAHTPFTEKMAAPRQAVAARDVEGSIELYPGHGYEHALEDLATWGRVWVVFVFDRASGWKAKVLPPRSERRRGVFATRSPHRPNPIGMSAVRLVGVEGLTVRVRDLDLLDGTPVLDLKPYVPYADAFPDAGSGWLETPDPVAPHAVAWSDAARAQVEWLAARGVDLQSAIEQQLALGPRPNAYRRIKEDDRGLVLALKEWRVRFAAQAGATNAVLVAAIETGYRPRDLALSDDPAVVIHRDFVAAFPR